MNKEMLDIESNYITTESTLSSLLEEKATGKIDCSYVSNVEWNEEQINRYLTRILNNYPIPSIVICSNNETKYLIDGYKRLEYAEKFKNNQIKIGEDGAELINIQDVIGKSYSDLPEVLQKRFDDFKISIIEFLNCDKAMIKYQLDYYRNL